MLIVILIISFSGLFIFYYKEPLKVLKLFVFMSPFAGTIYLRDNIVDIPGSKPILIIGFILLIILLINLSKSEKMPKYAFYFSFTILLIFTISVFRSLKNMDLINNFNDGAIIYNQYDYLLSNYIKPLIYFIPFILIIKYTKNTESLNYVMDIIYFTLIIFSFHLLYTYFVYIKGGVSEDDITVIYSETYSLHRNQIALFYICGLPFAFRKYFTTKKRIHIIGISIILVSIGFLFSRTGYVVAIFTVVTYSIIKRKSMIPIFIIMGILILSISTASISERAEIGIKERDINKISAGRIESIWLPLIKENIQSSNKFLFGDGLYAIKTYKSFLKGNVLFTIDTHNMYLELLIDAGVVSLIIMLTFYYVILRKALNSLKNNKNYFVKENLYACIISITCFLMAGMTGHSMFPMHSNILLWMVLGVTIVTSNLKGYETN